MGIDAKLRGGGRSESEGSVEDGRETGWTVTTGTESEAAEVRLRGEIESAGSPPARKDWLGRTTMPLPHERRLRLRSVPRRQLLSSLRTTKSPRHPLPPSPNRASTAAKEGREPHAVQIKSSSES